MKLTELKLNDDQVREVSAAIHARACTFEKMARDLPENISAKTRTNAIERAYILRNLNNEIFKAQKRARRL